MTLKVKITPNAHKNQIIGWLNETLKIKIAAPPQKGKANKELIKFLAKEWNVSKTDIQIVRGFKSSIKILEINNLAKEVLDKYEAAKQLTIDM